MPKGVHCGVPRSLLLLWHGGAQASEPGLSVRILVSFPCGEFCALATRLLLTPPLSLLLHTDRQVPIPPLGDLFSSLETWELYVRNSGEQVHLVLLGHNLLTLVLLLWWW